MEVVSVDRRPSGPMKERVDTDVPCIPLRPPPKEEEEEEEEEEKEEEEEEEETEEEELSPDDEIKDRDIVLAV